MIIIKITNSDKIALKLFVFIFLLIRSRFLIPLYSILIKCSPIKPIIRGNIKLNLLGRKTVIVKLKNELRKTSITLIKNKKDPVYKKKFKLNIRKN